MKEKFTIKKMFEAAVAEIKAISVKTAMSVVLVLVITVFAINTCVLNLKIDKINTENSNAIGALEENNEKLNSDLEEKNKEIEKQNQEIAEKDKVIKEQETEIQQQEDEKEALASEIAEQIDNIEIAKSSSSRSENSITSVKNSFAELENLIRDALGYSDEGNALVERLHVKADEYQDTVDRYPDYRPTVGPLVSPFGYRMHPILNVTKFHKGVDLDNVEGTAIWAAAKGIVVSAEDVGDYGYCIVIDHQNGLETRYAHLLPNMYVSVGDEVEKGQLIGRMGATGLATGAHLHFEVVLNGERVDPMDYIPE